MEFTEKDLSDLKEIDNFVVEGYKFGNTIRNMVLANETLDPHLKTTILKTLTDIEINLNTIEDYLKTETSELINN